MKTLTRIVASASVALALMAPLLLAPISVEAYDIILTQWNASQLEANGDAVKVTISGNTITFTWIDGNGGIGPNATNLKSIFWSNAVANVAGAATGTGDYAAIDDNGSDSSKWKNADGFGKFRVEVDDSAPNANRTLTVTFTFANNLDTTNFTASDFALHVQYSNGCSGYVSGTDVAGSSSSSCSAAGAVAVPEPLTAVLGGTGLLAMGYFGRKRVRRFAR